jgi:hypothetical protein
MQVRMTLVELATCQAGETTVGAQHNAAALQWPGG